MKATDVKRTRAARIIEQRGRVLPKTVHVKWVRNDDDPWLEVAEEIEKLVERGEEVYVGEYKLVRVRKARLDLKVSG